MERNVELEMEQQTLEVIMNAVNNFGSALRDYRKKEALTLDSLASRIGCSAAYIFRAEKGSRIVPIHIRVRILKEGLKWKASGIECFLVETVKMYEQKEK